MKLRLALVTTIFILVLFVAGCKPAGVPSDPATNPTAPSTEPTVPTTPDIENLSLCEKLPYIVADACKRAKTTETIDTWNTYVSHCTLRLGIPRERIPEEETGYHFTRFITTEGDYESMVYVLTLLTLTEEYKDCVYFTDPEWEYTFNRDRFDELFISDGYITAGYETVEDYYLAIKAGECEAPTDALLIWFDQKMLILSFGNRYEWENNLWPSLFANANSAD